jgi:hypothetical protein
MKILIVTSPEKSDAEEELVATLTERIQELTMK